MTLPLPVLISYESANITKQASNGLEAIISKDVEDMSSTSVPSNFVWTAFTVMDCEEKRVPKYD